MKLPASEYDVDRESDLEPAKKPWKSPVLRVFELWDDERAQLRASQDSMALLLKIRPEITAGS